MQLHNGRKSSDAELTGCPCHNGQSILHLASKWSCIAAHTIHVSELKSVRTVFYDLLKLPIFNLLLYKRDLQEFRLTLYSTPCEPTPFGNAWFHDSSELKTILKNVCEGNRVSECAVLHCILLVMCLRGFGCGLWYRLVWTSMERKLTPEPYVFPHWWLHYYKLRYS